MKLPPILWNLCWVWGSDSAVTILWDVTPCSPIEFYWHFGGTHCHHLQGEIPSFWLLVWLSLWHLRWQYILPKRRRNNTIIHGITSRKVALVTDSLALIRIPRNVVPSWNPRVHTHVHKSASLAFILRHSHQIHSFIDYFTEIVNITRVSQMKTVKTFFLI
jgi:hypothetical protein